MQQYTGDFIDAPGLLLARDLLTVASALLPHLALGCWNLHRGLVQKLTGEMAVHDTLHCNMMADNHLPQNLPGLLLK